MGYLYSLLSSIVDFSNPWILRLRASAENSRIILRALALAKGEYLARIRSATDWDGNRESENVFELMNLILPDVCWVVELSIPHLFPANERKLGEVVLDATKAIHVKNGLDYGAFLFARFPEKYFFGRKKGKGNPTFLEVPSKIRSHTALFEVL